MAASALVRGAAQGGRVVVVADAGVRTVQALVRWDPAGHADAELAEREEVGLPPAKRIAVLQGAPGDVQDLLERVTLPADTDQLGPVPVLHRVDNASEGAEATDVQVVLQHADDDGRALVEVHVRPLVWCVWWGGLLLTASALWSALGRRR